MGNRIIWIEDEIEIAEVLEMLLEVHAPDLKVSFYPSWENVAPEAGDLVVHDLIGVGEAPAKVDGVTYLVSSGSGCPDTHIDIPKPCKIEDIITIVRRNL